MARPQHIELGDGTKIPILYEDRNVLAIDKPAGWMLAPTTWDRTGRNLQLALESSLNERAYWARARNLKFLRHVHRLDADTSGLLLLAKSPGVLTALSRLFETRRVEKFYLAVVRGLPGETNWVCALPLAPHPERIGLMRTDPHHGKAAETRFRVLARSSATALIEAQPLTGRTHQIRVHLTAAGHPVLGDPLYSTGLDRLEYPRSSLALRAFRLAYPDPFQKKLIRLQAPWDHFVRAHGFEPQCVA